MGFVPSFTAANGVMLLAAAMLVGGWDGDANRTTPGLPTAGWAVRAEGFHRMF